LFAQQRLGGAHRHAAALSETLRPLLDECFAGGGGLAAEPVARLGAKLLEHRLLQHAQRRAGGECRAVTTHPIDNLEHRPPLLAELGLHRR